MLLDPNPDLEYLAEFLADEERPEGTFSFLELRGFLFAVARS